MTFPLKLPWNFFRTFPARKTPLHQHEGRVANEPPEWKDKGNLRTSDMGIYWDFSGICMACAWWDMTNINQSYPISQFWVCLKTLFFRESEVFIDHPALTRNWGYAEFLKPLACAEKTLNQTWQWNVKCSSTCFHRGAFLLHNANWFSMPCLSGLCDNLTLGNCTYFG